MLKNLEAEESLLGCILVEGELIKETTLEPKHFADERHKRIFKAMRDVDSSGQPVEMVTVVTELGDTVEAIGGTSYLVDLASSVPSVINFETYQTLIYEAFKLRDMQKTALDFANNPSDEGILQVYQKTVELQEIGIKNNRTKMDVLTEIYNDMYQEKGEITGVETGLADLDAMTGGWQGSDLIIVAARPSMGKTAFALNLAQNAALKGGVVDVFLWRCPTVNLLTGCSAI
ncbi:replicative DNA helicase [Bacillus subtilis]|uniref:replicative DNA helicase n=1 Tax=Bacillus subtilis TaxID=1423 RepID=UPI00249A30D3|nr:DnaB-like helicase N-terminal domain-containing protein [Bacillus subtilis]